MAPGALLAYLGLAFGVFSNAWRDPFVRGIGIAGDPSMEMWFLAWFPYAIGHGLNPFLTNFADYPDGANLLWSVSLPLVALLLTPVTAAFGTVVAYDLMMTLAVALSAWTAFLLLRRYVRRPVAAAVGGLLYGFSPYMLAQSMAHPQMTLVFMPPLILLLVDEIVRVQRRSPVLLGALLAAAGVVQFFIGEEVLVITGLLTVMLLVVAAALWPDEVLPRLRYAAGATAIAVGLFAAAVAWPVWYQFLGPRHISGVPHQQNMYVSDLLGFWVPTKVEWLAPGRAIRISSRFMGNITEWNAYVGVPLTLLLAWTAFRRWSNGWVRLATLVGLLVAIVSLGVTVHVGGTVKAWLPAFTAGLLFLVLPGRVPARVLVLLTFGVWFALWRLPILSSLLPARLTLFMFLLAGLLVAIVDGLAGLGRHRLALGVGALLLALAPLVPRLPFPTSTFTVPAFFAPGGQVSRIPEGSVAVVAPVITYNDVEAARWQASAGMRYRMPGGYLLIPAPPPEGSRQLGPPAATTDALIGARYGNKATLGDPDARREIREQLAAWHVRTVIVGPMENQDAAVELVTWVLERPPEAVQGVYVWWDVDRGPT